MTGVQTCALPISTVGADFTGSTTITNTSGDLAGTVVATQANIVAVKQEDRITVSGSSGTALVVLHTPGSVTRTMTWDAAGLPTTIDNFVTAYAGDFATAGVVITRSSSVYLKVVAGTAGVAFDITMANSTGTLDGAESNITPNTVAVARIDTITLTGYEGTANILCDGVTQEVAITETLEYTTDWNTRGGSESKPLLEIIGDEIANQMSRPRQYLSLPIMESNQTPNVNLLGNFQDVLNSI